MNGRTGIASMLVIALIAAGPLAAPAGAAGQARAGPDLAFRPGSLVNLPDEPHVGDEVITNVTVENAGTADIDGNFTVTFFLNDTGTPLKPAESNVTYSGIPAGESYNVSIGWGTAGLASGVNYTILVVLDLEDRVAEDNETNNRLEQNISFLPQRFPDLSVSPDGVWFDPSPPAAGDNITVTVAVQNHGDAASRFVDVFFYLNDTTTPLAGFVTLKDLNASGSQNASNVWDARALPPGSYDILVFVNPRWATNHHTELDTADNNLTIPVVLGKKVADLAVLGLDFSPPSPKVGDTVVVTVELHNAGNGSSPGCAVGLYRGYELEPVASGPVPPLGPGASASVDIDWNTTGTDSGFNVMRVVVDPGYSFTDTNRTNNSRLWNLTLAGEVDLSLEDLSISPAGPRKGDAVAFTVSVRNRGSLRCGSANLTLSVGGTEADRLPLMTIAAGGVMNATLGWSTSGLIPGVYDYELRVLAGPPDHDTRPENNLLKGSVTVAAPSPSPDLRVSEIRLPAQPPRAGDLLTVGVVVENAGDLDASASTVMVTLESSADMTLWFSEAPVAVPPVAAGRTATVNVSGDTARFAPGIYTLEATVDYGNAVAESNETNNRLAVSLTILGPEVRLAKLSVGEISFAGERVEGRKVDIVVPIANTGNATALDVVVSFIIDGKTAATRNLDQIPAGTSRNATLTWTFPSGDHTVKVLVSSAGIQDATGERRVSVGTGASDQGLLLLALGLGLILILAGAAAAVRLRRPPAPGPKVKLVEEEE
ncbi:MAG: hypothetical protein FJ149_01505 [Euryarchaeota archaeon]|nr:hypothetical protein [Euryarchaeota archaeon]